VINKPMWSGERTRAAFIQFFETKGHTFWASSAVRRGRRREEEEEGEQRGAIA
jgi:hypothetical protein